MNYSKLLYLIAFHAAPAEKNNISIIPVGVGGWYLFSAILGVIIVLILLFAFCILFVYIFRYIRQINKDRGLLGQQSERETNETQDKLMKAMEDLKEKNSQLSMQISRQKALEEKLRIRQKEYKIAVELSNCTVLKYDIPGKTISILSQGIIPLNFSEATTDFPELAIQKGYVAPESVNNIRELFATIQRGESNKKSVLAFIVRNNQKCWTDVRYFITHDESGNPVTAILSLKDKSKQKQIEEMFRISNTLLEFSKESKLILVVNLSSSHIEYVSEHSYISLIDLSVADNIEQVMEMFLLQNVYEKDRELCTRFFDVSRFFAEFDAENYEESLDFRYMNPEGEVRWNNVQTRLVRDIDTKDIKLYLVFSDIHEQKLAELELMRQSQIDPLTGLMSRESFIEEIELRCAAASGEHYNAIIIIDIDNLKTINDTLGRETGDQVLIEVARRLKNSMHSCDVVARFSGDGFIALMPAMPSVNLIEQNCVLICNNISYELKDGLFVTASLGLAICPEDGHVFETLLKKANTAMYQARDKGGNRCARFSEHGIQHISSDNGEALRTEEKSKIFARTFGYFDLFVDGEAVHFSGTKEKELLAILIDRNGGTLTSEEGISILWPDEPADEKQLSRYRKVAMRLKNTLQKLGIEDILVTTHGVRNIDVSKIECDYYKFLKGDPEFRKLFSGAYMLNYSWAEETIATLMHLKN